VSFRFERDTFCFANELVWRYEFDPAGGAVRTVPSDPPPKYWHRCFVLVRSARQFLYHALFDPQSPVAGPETYRELVRQVVRRNPRRVSSAGQRIRIPGYAGLRAFSQTHEELLKAELGAAWESYFLRSHWRIVFPVPRWHQERIAAQLRHKLLSGLMPMVHLFRFPRITINHGLLVFSTEESASSVRFEAYDPNMTSGPVSLFYEKSARQFTFPASCYWAGGKVSVIEIFRGGLY
jgi:hypothetical protein